MTINSRYLRWTLPLALIVVGILWLFVGRGSGVDGKGATSKPLPAVSTVTPQLRDLPVVLMAQGHLVPLNQVDVRAQMSGIIRTVHFHEGDDIKVGQLLFTLDDSDARAQWGRAQAQLAQVKATLDDALREHGRSRELLAQHFISSAVLESSASKVEVLQAQYRAAQADVDSARVLVDRTRIVAPIAAKAGAVIVHPGSLAQQSDATPLVTLLQFNPIGAEFSVPEQQLERILAARRDGLIRVSLHTGNATIAGKLIFINNNVNSSTGTISLKASFPNQDEALWPGEFARLSIAAGYDRNAMVLPPQSVLEGPKGHFVYVLDAGNKVSSQPVTLLRMQDEQAMVDGVGAGLRVVVEGNQNIRAGMTVQVVTPNSESTLRKVESPR